MRKKIIKATLYIIGGIMALLLVLLLALWSISPGKADPITGPDGAPLAGSISVIESITLGGIDQYLFIRGADSTKPVMLFLHGGPGSPETAFMINFNRDIEKDFVMVYWEQRGAGKSYSKKIPAESMNMAQFIADTRELTEYLMDRFNQEKIYLMGHSWGSLLGILTAYKHPEYFHAYFGIGQVGNQYEGEQLSYEWAKEQARNHDDHKSLRALERLSFPDSLATSEVWKKYLMTQRKYVNAFGGGTTRDATSMWPLIKIVMQAREYTLNDKMNFMAGSMFSLKHLWHEVVCTNLFHEIDSMHVPVYIFHGNHDYTTPYPIAKEFYEQLKAPHKGFFTFQNSAHSPVFEEAEKFNAILKDITQGQ